MPASRMLPPEPPPAPVEGAVAVLLPVALGRPLTYQHAPGPPPPPGAIVRVPLGRRVSLGVVWGRAEETPSPTQPLRAIADVLDVPPLPAGLRSFIAWVAAWTMSPLGMVLRMALRDPETMVPARPRLAVRATGIPCERITPARARVLREAADGPPLSKAELARRAGVSTGVVDALVDEGALEAVLLPPLPVALPPDPDHAPPALDPAQREVADRLAAAVAAGGYGIHLVEGVTGSGKTEVYHEAIAEALRQGRQVLLLMPEIALTPQVVARFERRFGVAPGLWHAGVSTAAKGRLWQAVAVGDARVVVGARSALSLPFQRLGLIIVDEEHDQAYKQDEGVSYHARDMAVVRGRIEQALVVLVSATPSIETRVNAEAGRYHHHRLRARPGGRAMPALAAIDLRVEGPPRGRWLAPRLVDALAATIAAGDQALLFLNRRGFAPVTLCRHCGHRCRCPQCAAHLVEHRFRRALVCHHCGHTVPRPSRCEACGTEDSLVPCGPGVERLAEEVAALFPDVRCIVLSSDFAGGPARLREELREVAAGTFPIVIGTQLVAKGHDFPGLALVGVVDADMALGTADPRAAERTFQLLSQVTGRAGRGARPGRGLIQTHDPDHPVLQAILRGDHEGFYREEIALRRAAALPPFTRLAAIIVSARDRFDAEGHARAIARAGHGALAAFPACEVLGPAEAPLALLRGRHRQRLLLRAPRDVSLQAFVAAVLEGAPKASGSIHVDIDIEPMSFL